MLAVLNDVIGFENLPKVKISVKTDALLGLYLQKKNKAQAVEDYETKEDQRLKASRFLLGKKMF